MKTKNLILLSLILCILTMCAVSASQDCDNLTVDEVENGEIVDTPESGAEILNASDDGDSISQNENTESLNEGLITDYKYHVYLPDLNLYGKYYEVSVEAPDDAYGNVYINIDGLNVSCVNMEYGYFYYELSELNLECGQHNLTLKYMGDDKYAGFTYEKTFRLDKVVIDIPDEVIFDSYDNLAEGFWIKTIEDISGNVTVVIDDKKLINASIKDIYNYYEDENYYYVSVLKALGSKPLSFGLHTYNITYDGEYKYTKSGVFNSSYTFYYFCRDYSDDELPYGENITLKLWAPTDATSNILVNVNGVDLMECTLNKGNGEIILSDLAFGNNNLTLKYLGDEKYPEKTINGTLGVIGRIKYCETYCFNDGNVISITLPDDATGQLCIYKKIYDENWDYTLTLIANSTIVNGRANYSLDGWQFGHHNLLLKCVDTSYKVAEEDAYIEVLPKTDYPNIAVLGEKVNLTVEIPANITDDIIIKLYPSNENWDYDYDPYETYTNQFNVPLRTSRVGFQIIQIQCGEFSYTYRFKVTDESRDWNMTVDFPERVLCAREMTIRPYGYSDKIDGYFKLYIDGFYCGQTSYSYGYLDPIWVDSSDFSVGTHTWQLNFTGDSYFNDQYANGTFVVDWADIAQLVEIGTPSQNITIRFNKPVLDNVTLYLNESKYCEVEMDGYRATISLDGLKPGATYNYELVCGDLIKRGSFEVSYVINVEIDGHDELDQVEYLNKNELKIILPSDATGSVNVCVNGKNYIANVENGIATLFIQLNWDVNQINISYSGDEKYGAKQIQKNCTIDHANLIKNYTDGKLSSVSVILPSDAEGVLHLSINYNDVYVNLVNGTATYYFNDLPLGLNEVSASCQCSEYYVCGIWVFIPVEPEMNITRNIFEGENCTIQIYLPNSTSDIEIYIDGELNTTSTFENGKLNVNISDLTLGTHYLSFRYTGGGYNNLFYYFDEYDYDFCPIRYEINVTEKQLIDPDFDIIIKDVNQSTPINVTVNANNKFTGDVTVKIDGNDILVHIVDGKGYNETDLILPVSAYTATLDFDETSIYAQAHAETTFNVWGIRDEAKLNISVPDIDLGDDLTICIDINENVTKNVVINIYDCQPPSSIYDPTPYVPFYNKTFQVPLIDGKASLVISDLNASGKYMLIASYEGDEKVLPDNKTYSFKVLEDMNLEVALPEFIYENETLYANLTINPPHGSDIINLDVELNPAYSGTSIFIPFVMFVNGGATSSWTLSGLDENTYELKFKFSGNDYYKACNVSKTFEVKKVLLSPELNVAIDNITVGNDAKITFTIHKNATGKVVINVNGTVYEITLNGNASYEKILSGLGVGTYTVNVSYAGGANSANLNPILYPMVKYYDFASDSKITTFKVKPVPSYANLSAFAGDVYEGQNVTVNVSICPYVTGNVSININGEKKLINIVNGYGKYNISGLTPNNYTYQVEFAGDDYYLSDVWTVSFKVFAKMDAGLVVSANDLTVGENATVNVIINKNITGKVTINVNGEDREINIVDGRGKYVLENLKANNYNFDVTFKGDVKFNPVTKTVSFKVKLKTISFTVNIADVEEGNPITVKVTANDTITDDVIVKIAGRDVLVHLDNGVGINNTNLILPSGNYVAKLTFDGNDEFNTSSAETQFNVTIKAIDPNLTISVSSITEGEVANVIITTNNTFSGSVRVEIANGVYDVSVLNGYGNKTVSGLIANNYTAVARFTATDKFLASTKNITFEVAPKVVPPVDPSLAISVANIVEGEVANVIITTNNTFSGSVRVEIANGVYDVSVLNGYGNKTVSGLIANNYTAVARFTATDKFLASTKNITFEVAPKVVPPVVPIDPNLAISVSSITEGQPAVVVITTNNTFSGIVLVKIKDINVDFNVDVVNGFGKISLNDLAKGDYSAVAIFEATDKFLPSTKNTTFNVAPKPVVLIDPALTISVSDITQGSNAVITITTNQTFSGNVTLKVGSASYVVSIVNGKATKSLSSLGVGTYNATAIFSATDVFSQSQKSATFKVNKKVDVIKLTINTVTVKRSAKKLTIIATLKINGKAVKGKKINFKFNKKNYSAKTNARGIAKITIKKSVLKKLKVNKKVTYLAKYLTKVAKKTVKVKK